MKKRYIVLIEILAILIALSSILFARYSFDIYNEVTISLKDARIEKIEVSLEEDSKSATIEITANTSKKGGEIYYKFVPYEKEEGAKEEWKKYDSDEPLKITENGTIYARIQYEDGNGPEAKKEITDIILNYAEYEIVESKEELVRYYKWLSTALDQAESGNIVRALENTEETKEAILPKEKTQEQNEEETGETEEKKTLTLDLAGKTITLNNVSITNNGNLTITGEGTLTSNTITIINGTTGELTKEGNCTIAGTGKAGEARTNESVTIDNYGIATLKAGTVSSEKKSAVYNEKDGQLIVSGATLNSNAEVTINNYSELSKNQKASVIIKKGTISSTSAHAIINRATGLILIEDGDISSSATNGNPTVYNENGTIKISGGTITSDNDRAVCNYFVSESVPGKGIIEISGGTITGAKAVSNRSEGTIKISDGLITGTSNYGVYVSKGTLILGIKEDEEPDVSVEAPSIEGKTVGIKVEEGATFNFYDGIITGPVDKSIDGDIDEVQPGYVRKTTENEDGKTERTFLVKKGEATDDKITIDDIADQVYTGSEIEPKPVVKYEDKVLEEGNDYELSYRNNKDAGTATVIITFKGEYSGTIEKTFKITQANGKGTVSITGWTYGDEAKVPTVESETNETEGVTYKYYIDEDCTTETTVENDGATENGGAPKNAGTYYIKATIKATQNYKEVTAKQSFTIAKKQLTIASATATEKTYDGNKKAEGTITLSAGAYDETPTATGTFTYKDKDAGENKTVEITNIALGQEYEKNYTISQETYSIETGKIKKATLKVTYEGETITYGAKPNLTLIVEDFVNDEKAEDLEDYTEPKLETNAKNVGEYTLDNGLTVIDGVAKNYTFTYNIGTLTITASENVNVSLKEGEDSNSYDGTPKKPGVTVTDPITGETIPEDEYDVTYENNEKAGQAKAKVKFKDGKNHQGTYEITFTIEKAERKVEADETIYVGKGTTSELDFTYTGETVTAEVEAAADTTVKAEIKDSSNNGKVSIQGKEAGETTVTITVPASDNYKEVTKEIHVIVTDFSILPTTATISKDGTVEIKPTIKPDSIKNVDAATTITWVSDNADIAKVSSAETKKGGSITVTGVEDGEATITATLNGQTQKATITVDSTASTATVKILKDGNEWTGSGIKVALYKEGEQKYIETASSSTVLWSEIELGNYDIYAVRTGLETTELVDTNIDITVSERIATEATIEYYTLTKTERKGTTLTIKEDNASGNEIASTTAVLKNTEIYIEATAKAGYHDATITVGGQPANNNSIHTISAKTEVISSATANEYKIKYEDGKGETQEATGTYDQDIVIPNPSKEGYTFEGWSAEDVGENAQSGTSSENMKKWDGSETKDTNFRNLTDEENEDVTLKANWKANEYTIKYELNGGTNGVQHPDNGTYDQDIVIDNPRKAGYTFEGWTASSTDGLGSTAQSRAGEESFEKWDGNKTKNTHFKNLTSQNNGIVTLTATWKDTQGPTITIEKTSHNTFEWTATDNEEVAGYQITTTEEEPNEWKTGAAEGTHTIDPNTEKTYYVWVKDKEGNVSSNSITSYKLTKTEGQGTTLTIRENDAEGTVIPETTCVLEETTIYVETTAKAGYHDATIAVGGQPANNNSIHTISESTEVISSATANEYTIKYDDGTGTTQEATGTYDQDIEITNPSKEGYTFEGWTAEDVGENAQTGTSSENMKKWDGKTKTKDTNFRNLTDEENEDVTLTPHWTANKYTIEYELDGGTDGDKHPSNGTYDQDIEIDNPSKEGYTFTGWTSSSTDGLGSAAQSRAEEASFEKWDGNKTTNTYFKNLTAQNNGIVTLTATWKDTQGPTITIKKTSHDTFEWKAEDNEEVAGYLITTDDQEPSEGDWENGASSGTHKIDPNEENTYYVWVKDKEGNVSSNSINSYKLTKIEGTGTTLKIKENNEEGEEISKDICVLDGTVIYIEVVANKGYNTPEITVNSEVISNNSIHTISEATEVSSSATANEYTIKYEDGTGTTKEETGTYDQDIVIPNPSKEGYTFEGWTAEGVGDNAQTGTTTDNMKDWDGKTKTKDTNFRNLTDEENEDVTLKANWKANEYIIKYKLDGGTDGDKHPDNGTYDQDIVIDNPSKAGYTFTGWTSSANDGLESTAQSRAEEASFATWDGNKTTSTHFKNLTAQNNGIVTLTATWKDTQEPTITIKKTSRNTFEWTAEDNDEVAGYLITTKDQAPSDGEWKTGATKGTHTIDPNIEQTYYVWVKDKEGNVSSKEIKSYKIIKTEGQGTTLTIKENDTNGKEIKETTCVLEGTTVYIEVALNTGYNTLELTVNKETFASGNTEEITKTTEVESTAIANTYKIKYNYDEGNAIEDAPTTAKYDQTIEIPNPTKSGATFAGWTAEDLGSNAQSGEDQDSLSKWTGNATTSTYFKNLTDQNEGEVTLKAKWTANTVAITINNDGKAWAGSGINVALHKDDKEYGYDLGSASGSTVTWTEVEAGTYRIYAGKTGLEKDELVDTGVDIEVLKEGTSTQSINYYTLTRTEGKGTTLTIKTDNAQGNTITKTTEVLKNTQIYVTVAANTGYHTPEIIVDGTKFTNETKTIVVATEVKSTATPNKFTVTYDDGTGTKQKEGTYDEDIEIEPPTKEGFTFAGWTSSDVGSNAQSGETADEMNSWNGKDPTTDSHFKNLTDNKDEDVTLKATWTANTYKIEYYQGNGNTAGNATKLGESEHTYGTKQKLAKYEELTKDGDFELAGGWTFAGWSKADASSATEAEYTDEHEVQNLTAEQGKTLKLYAIFKRDISFISGISQATNNKVEQRYNPYMLSLVTSVTVPNLGTAIGWTPSGYRTDTKADSNTISVGATLQLAATSEAPTYYGVYERTLTIAYNGNEETSGTTQSQTNTQYYNTNGTVSTVEFTLQKNGFVKTGYRFSKWAEGSTGGTKRNEGEKYTFGPSVSGNTTQTMYAIWLENNYEEVNSSSAHVNYYTTLAEAFSGATTKNTIKPLKNTTESTVATVETGRTLTLDLNGYAISMNNMLTNNGTLTIKDSTTGGSGKITGTGTLINNAGSKASLTVTGGALTTTSVNAIINSGAGATVVVGTSGDKSTTSPAITGRIIGSVAGVGDITVHSGKITGTTLHAIYTYESVTVTGGDISVNTTVEATDLYTVYARSKTSKITITGGTISNKNTNEATTGGQAVTTRDADAGTIEITGGKITSTKTVAVRNFGTTTISGNPEITGKTFGLSIGAGTATITGGKISATGGVGVYATTGTVTIGDGSNAVSKEVPSIEGTTYGVQINESGTFNFYDGVIKGAEGQSISKIPDATPTGYGVQKTTSGSIETAILSNKYNLIKVSDSENIVSNGDFEKYTITNAPAWDGELNGVPGDSTKAYNSTDWGNGSNSSVASANKGYHAHMKIIDGNNVFDFKTNEDTEVDQNRWLGINQTITGSKLTAGKKYAITMDVYRVSGNSYLTSGIYHVTNAKPSTFSFYSGEGEFIPSATGKWETLTWIFTLSSDYLNTTNPRIYVYGHKSGEAGEIYVDNVRLQEVTEKQYNTLYTTTELATPTKTGYTFSGWYNDESYKTQLSIAKYFSTSTATFENTKIAGTNAYIYAKYTPQNYTINLDPNGGTYNGVKTTSSIIRSYDAVVNLGVPTRHGYDFVEWSNADGTIVDKNLLTNATSPTELSSTGTNAAGTWRTASNGSLNDGTRSVIDIENAPIEGITKGFQIIGNGTNTLDIAQDQIPVTIGKKYTVSVWAKGTGTLRLQHGNSSYESKTYTLSNVTSWTKYSFTFAAGTTGTATGSKTNIYFGNRGTGTIEICGMKLEEEKGFSPLLWENATKPTKLVAQWQVNASGNYGEYNKSNVLVESYETLAEALANVTSGNTIKPHVNRSETAAATLGSGKTNVTLDLNGKTITLSKTLTNAGTLTIGGTGTLTASAVDTVTNTGTLTKLGASTIKNTAASTYYAIKNSGKATLNAGTVDGVNAIQNQTTGKITINGATITAKSNAIFDNSNANSTEEPTIEITSGKMTSSDYAVIYNESTNYIRITGGTLEGVHGILAYGSPKIVITGGKITATADVGIRCLHSTELTLGTKETTTAEVNTNTPEISGKLYGITKDSNAKIHFYDGKVIGGGGQGSALHDGITDTQPGYGVQKTTANGKETAILVAANYEEYNGNTLVSTYETLANATANVTSGNTIKPIFTGTKSEASPATLASGKTAILDLNGKTIELSGVSITNNGTLTIKDSTTGGAGKITGTGTLINNAGSKASLTVTGGALTTTYVNAIVNSGAGATVVVGTSGDKSTTSPAITGRIIGSVEGVGDITVHSGKITGTTLHAIYTYESVTVTGGDISVNTSVKATDLYTIMARSTTSKITITGGTISNKNTNADTTGGQAVTTKDGSPGTIEITGGTIISTVSYAVNNVNITNISGSPIITGKTRGINMGTGTGTITVKGGKISATAGVGIYATGGTVTLGDNTAPVSADTPSVTGTTYGIQAKTFNFYDGVINGKTNQSISKMPDATPKGYGVQKTTANNIETAILVTANYAEYSGNTDTIVSYYATLADALTNVTSGNTIKPIFTANSRSENPATLEAGKNITFDTNSKTIAFTSGGITNQGTLTIKGGGKLSSSGNIITNYNIFNSNSVTYEENSITAIFVGGGTVNISGGKIINTSDRALWIDEGGDVTLSSVTVESSTTSTEAIRNSGTLTVNGTTSITCNNNGIRNYETAKLTINKGTIKSVNKAGIYADGGTVIVNGGTITASDEAGILMNGGTLTVNDGSITGDDGIWIGGGTVYAYGGNITGSTLSGISNGEKSDSSSTTIVVGKTSTTGPTITGTERCS